MSLGWSPVFLALWAAAAPAPQESYLGLHTAPARLFGDDDPFDAEDDAFDKGLQVTSVVENSPARQAGFQVGDVLLRVNGRTPRSPRHLESLVAALPAGSTIAMEARRGSKVLVLTARTVPRLVPREPPDVRGFIERRRLGLVVEDVTSKPVAGSDTPGPRVIPGVLIRRLLTGSPCRDAGLHSGDLLLSINGETVHGGADFLALAAQLAPGSKVELLTRRASEERRVRVTIRDPGRHVSKFFFPLLVDYEQEVAREKVRFGLFWPLNLFKYERVENRRTYCFLWFICFSTGSNEVLEDVE